MPISPYVENMIMRNLNYDSLDEISSIFDPDESVVFSQRSTPIVNPAVYSPVAKIHGLDISMFERDGHSYSPPRSEKKSSSESLSEEKDSKRVTFSSASIVVLVPTTQEYHSAGIDKDVWWSNKDLVSFYQTMRREIEGSIDMFVGVSNGQELVNAYIETLLEKAAAGLELPVGLASAISKISSTKEIPQSI